MKKEIKTTTLLNYIELYNKYEYLIEKYIMKICPRRIYNEDFVQDIKLGLLEYIKNNEAFHRLTKSELRYSYISRYLSRFIDRLNKEYNARKKSLNLYNFEDDLVFDDSCDMCDLPEVIDRVLSTLSEKEASVIRLRFYDDLTLDKIGVIEGFTGDRARQILAKALRKLRHPSRSRQLKVYNE